MAHMTLIGGKAYEIKAGRTLVNGKGYDIAKGRTLVDGKGYDITFTIPLEEVPEGETVTLVENNSLVEFIVAKHDYESAQNGLGHSLLTRAEGYGERVWSELREGSYEIPYKICDLDAWLSNDYKAMLAPDIQAALMPTKIRCATLSAGDFEEIERSIFVLAQVELKTVDYGLDKREGSPLPTAEILGQAFPNSQWTRTRHDKLRVWTVNYSDTPSLLTGEKFGGAGITISNTSFARPSLTLPGSIRVNSKTFEIVP